MDDVHGAAIGNRNTTLFIKHAATRTQFRDHFQPSECRIRRLELSLRVKVAELVFARRFVAGSLGTR